MKNKSNNLCSIVNLIIISLVILSLPKPIYSQSTECDSLFHPYHVNYWVTGGIIVGGITLENIGIRWITNKSTISTGELENLNRDDISSIDYWALNFDPSKMSYYKDLSSGLLTASAFIPVLTLLDGNIRQDWLDVLLMYAQTQTITNNFYLYSPFGATFQNRLRPVVYYDEIDLRERTASENRNSLYSGHVAATTAASFFTAKIFCDYHPELGWKKYLVYSAATIPPLIMSYFRLRSLRHFPTDLLTGFGVGVVCGILIPELHRIEDKNILLGIYSSFEGTGISMRWQPNFLR